MPKIVVALYRDMNTAEEVVRELVVNGFPREDIGLVAQNPQGTEIASNRGSEEGGSHAVAGAGAGAVLGGLAGLVVGLGALAIPGIGPIIAAGPLATTLAGAGIGAVAGGLIGALTSSGVPEQDARAFAEGVRQGGTLVTVRAADDRVDHAAAIMNGHNPIDINEQTRQFVESPTLTATGMGEGASTEIGAESHSPTSEQSGMTQSGTSESGANDNALATGQSGMADSETSHRQMTAPDLTEGQPQIYYSQADVPNPAFGRPDLSREGERQLTGTGEGAVRPGDFARYEGDFRQHYDLVYSSRGQDYYFYEPAYRYGYDLAGMDQYRGRRWNELEPDARRDWERTRTDKPWENIREAVRHGWERLAGKQDMSGYQDGAATLGSGDEEYDRGAGEGHYWDPRIP